MKSPRIYQNNRKGFTLIELLIVLLLFSFVIALIYNMYNMGVFVWKSTERRLWTVQEARMSLERIIRESRGAKGNITIESANPDREGFKFQKANGTEFIGFYRYKNDDKIRRYVDNKAGNIIATNVASFSVTKKDNGSYEIKIEFNQDRDSYTVSGVFTPRNK
mgnify:CR=1 FL=1